MTLHWSTHQLTEYLSAVSGPDDAAGAMLVGLERAIEALEAEVGAVIIGAEVHASIGFGARGVPAEFLAGALGEGEIAELPGLGPMYLARGALNRIDSTFGAGAAPTSTNRLVAGRLDEGCTGEEIQMLQAMALVLGLVLDNLTTLEAERSRHRLVQTLLAIQRSISTRRPLQELLDGVTSGASALLGGCPVALLLADPANPGALMPASGFDFDQLDQTTLAAVETAMAERSGQADQPPPGTGRVIAESVAVDGSTAGCLAARVDGAKARGREQQDLLSAFAQQVSLVLTDARTLEAVREAHHDSITGLPNRALFLQQLERARHTALGQQQSLVVLFIDLDRFKAVNDTLGHQAGDELLTGVAQRIRHCIRSEDIAARLGGDEFSVLLERSDVDVARALATRLIDSLARAFAIAGREVFIGASVGIAELSSAHADGAAVLSDADVAMYCAKREGRGRSVVFEPHMLDAVASQLSLRTDLQHALGSDQLWLAYQPIIRLDGGQVVGAEALMRWNHPQRGQVMPGEFIPVAEETDMIIAMGQWAIHRGLSEVTCWRTGSSELGLSLNVSARQIADPNLPAVLAAALAASGFPTESLTLEITESILMEDPEVARERLTSLKRLGVRLAIDDFGTGYSSLSYVRRFPVDDVKIDRSFVTGLSPQARDDIAIVRSVLSLCQSLRLRTVAEGIERPEQWALLADLGCELGQGYLIARPMPAADWVQFAAASATQ